MGARGGRGAGGRDGPAAIGREDQPADWAKTDLELRDRTLGGVTSPPEGLYFEQAEYPAEYDLPAASLSGFPIQP